MQGLKAGVVLLLCCWVSNLWAQTQAKQVLVSIHPVALLIKSAWPQVQVNTLMPANQSPHDFALKPSHRQIIADANHVVWLGQEIEPYLTKVVQYHPSVLDLSVLFDEQEAKGNDKPEHTDDHQEHNHGDHDPHIWLNPDAVPAILALVQAQLDLPKPVAFLTQLSAWQQQAQQALSKNPNGFVSFHDVFHYWVDYFQLTQQAVLAINPEQPIGTRHIIEVRKLLEQGNVSCLFVEPQFKASIVDKLRQGTTVAVVNIDPLASQFAVNSAGFLEFYQYLQQQFITCLKSK